MAKETKLQVWTNVQNQVLELVENSKVSKKFSEELLLILETNIAPKNGGGSSLNPPKLDEDGNIVEAYCRYHQRYEKVEDMVISNNKSKGYCKASISLWNKTNSEIKKLDSSAVDAMSDADFDKAQEIAKKAKELKDNFNKPEFYDYDRDWAKFNGVEVATPSK
jgi:benzoyl-CoA reductase/2-hydroxyglutaryl-CoA dehydratase subunit BcrC/BadD/HgdB